MRTIVRWVVIGVGLSIWSDLLAPTGAALIFGGDWGLGVGSINVSIAGVEFAIPVLELGALARLYGVLTWDYWWVVGPVEWVARLLGAVVNLIVGLWLITRVGSVAVQGVRAMVELGKGVTQTVSAVVGAITGAILLLR